MYIVVTEAEENRMLQGKKIKSDVSRLSTDVWPCLIYFGLTDSLNALQASGLLSLLLQCIKTIASHIPWLNPVI